MDIEKLIMQLENVKANDTKSTTALDLDVDSRKKMEMEEDYIELSLPKIRIVGVGGAGNNFASALFSNVTSKLVEIIAINTDASQ